MSQIYPNLFTHTILNSEVPLDELPIVQIGSDSEVYGTISIFPELPLIDTAYVNVFPATAPDASTYGKWVRLYPQLTSCSTDGTGTGYDTMQLSVTGNQRNLKWTFLPAAIPQIASGQYYSLEFFINQNLEGQSTELVTAKVIVQVKDFISPSDGTYIYPTPSLVTSDRKSVV